MKSANATIYITLYLNKFADIQMRERLFKGHNTNSRDRPNIKCSHIKIYWKLWLWNMLHIVVMQHSSSTWLPAMWYHKSTSLPSSESSAKLTTNVSHSSSASSRFWQIASREKLQMSSCTKSLFYFMCRDVWWS